jgi:hypothetical protein
MVRDLGLEMPYEKVRRNQWTHDAMHDMMRMAAHDLDGDGIFTMNDRWGIASTNGTATALLIGGGWKPVYKDGDGVPQLRAPDERFIRIFDKAHSMLDRASGLWMNAQAAGEVMGALRI